MVVIEGIIRDLLRLLVWYPLRWFITMLSVKHGILLLRTMGDLHYSLSKEKRRILLNNLSGIKVSSPDKAESVIRDYFRNHYIDRLLIFIFPKLNRMEITRHVEFTGVDNLDAALKKGKGVVLVHGHFGPVHLPLVSLAILGYRIKQIGFPSSEGLSWVGRNVAFRLRMIYESKMPAEIIKADSFLRPAFRWLQDNGIIMITGDGSGTDRHVGKHMEFKFLGQKVMFPLGPAILANKTASIIIPMFIVPGEKKLYKIIIEKPLTSDRVGEEKILHITDQFISKLENYVRICPGFMHFLDRFSPGALIMEER